VKRENLPGPAAGEDLDNLIRDGAMSMRHPVGPARMGQDDMAVVDAKLKVKGIAGLRVADASIMPLITTARSLSARRNAVAA
jgi:choline dehydrogenase